MKKAKKIKNNLDEMQEQKMLKIEHNGCWFAFWGLFVSMLVQALIYGRTDWRYVAGEWIVFMCLAIYLAIDCIRNGLWDRRLSPTPAVNMAASLIAGIVIFIFHFCMSYKNYNNFWGSAAVGLFMGLITFGACFVALQMCTAIYKRRVKTLEKDENEEDKESYKSE